MDFIPADKKAKIKIELKELRKKQRLYELKLAAHNIDDWNKLAKESHDRIEAKYGVKKPNR